MDRSRPTVKPVGSRLFVRDGMVTCPRVGDLIDVARCYPCNQAWEIRPSLRGNSGWVRCSFRPPDLPRAD